MTEPSPPLGPTPRRPFETTPVPTPSHSASPPATPSRTRSDSFPADSEVTERQGGSRNRSVLNLTASTLFGIYSPSGYESTREGPSTPWGTGALTPSRPPTIDEGRPIAFPALTAFSRPHASSLVLPTSRFGIRNHVIPFTLRTGLLFAFGIAYGIVVAHLHDNQQLAPVKVENIDRSSWRYMILWGVAGVFLGRLLPLVDVFWEEASLDPAEMASVSISAKSDASTTSPLVGGSRRDGSPETDGKTWMGADWNPAVRSIGAFIGIAFAIRKLPWQSTLQVSLTLALVNPFLWYLIDRSKPGFFLSSFVGIVGTTVLLRINPDMVPSPPVPSPRGFFSSGGSGVGKEFFDHQAMHQHQHHTPTAALISHESIYVWTWIASVLFCSCVCFGNVGRRLATGRLRGKLRKNTRI